MLRMEIDSCWMFSSALMFTSGGMFTIIPGKDSVPDHRAFRVFELTAKGC